MRCSICDWSPDTRSLFNEGLASSCSSNRLWRDPDTGDYICQDCLTYLPVDEDVEDGEIETIDQEFDND